MRSFIVATAITTTLLLSQGHAKSAEIKILSVVPLKTFLDELGPQFERDTGHKLIVEYDGSSQLKRRLEAGEAFDTALIYPEQDISSQSCRWHRIDGHVRGSDDLIPAAVWTSHPAAFSPRVAVARRDDTSER